MRSTRDSLMERAIGIAVLVTLLVSLGYLLISQPGLNLTFPNLYSGELNGSGGSDATLLDVPFVSQKEFYCSEASVAMVMQYYGFSHATQESVHENIGTYFEEMLYPLRNYLNCDIKPLQVNDLKSEIDENDPVIIRLQLGNYRHTVVLVGYEENFFYVHDPGVGKYQKMTVETLLKYWVPAREGYMAMVFN